MSGVEKTPGANASKQATASAPRRRGEGRVSEEHGESHPLELPILPADGGEITHCPHAQCGFKCCDFAQGNYIVMYPGELAAAQAAGRSTAHLEVADDGCGGHRAICRATDAATCDGGYKPLDCASYPLFPVVDSANSLAAVDKGEKCPLPAEALSVHLRWTLAQWELVIERDPEVVAWLRSARLVGYSRWDSLATHG